MCLESFKAVQYLQHQIKLAEEINILKYINVFIMLKYTTKVDCDSYDLF